MTSDLKSKYEVLIQQQLDEGGVDYTYEAQALKFTPPSKARRKTFDWWITTRSGKLIVVESKGWWAPKARLAEIECIKQNPEYDVRYVFMRSSTKINKTSKTSYADVCIKNNILFADGRIPDDWLDE